MDLLGIIAATIIVVLIAIYLSKNKKETNAFIGNSFRKEKNFETERNDEREKITDNVRTESENQKSEVEPPFQPPSDPEVL